MTLVELKTSLKSPSPPPGISDLVTALWYDAKGNWDRAHEVVQDMGSRDAAWIHAYLHRKEGDLGNASYWYSRAHQNMPSGSLEEEWDAIAEALL